MKTLLTKPAHPNMASINVEATWELVDPDNTPPWLMTLVNSGTCPLQVRDAYAGASDPYYLGYTSLMHGRRLPANPQFTGADQSISFKGVRYENPIPYGRGRSRTIRGSSVMDEVVQAARVSKTYAGSGFLGETILATARLHQVPISDGLVEVENVANYMQTRYSETRPNLRGYIGEGNVPAVSVSSMRDPWRLRHIDSLLRDGADIEHLATNVMGEALTPVEFLTRLKHTMPYSIGAAATTAVINGAYQKYPHIDNWVYTHGYKAMVDLDDVGIGGVANRLKSMRGALFNIGLEIFPQLVRGAYNDRSATLYRIDDYGKRYFNLPLSGRDNFRASFDAGSRHAVTQFSNQH